MRIRWLGWAGVEAEAQGERVVIDPLQDAAAVFAWLGERARAIPAPQVVPARPGAIAGLLTHLHRDHADAAALGAALRAGATVHEPVDYGGESADRLAVIQADQELTAAGLARQPAAVWTSIAPRHLRSPRCPPSTEREIRRSPGCWRPTASGCCTSATPCGTGGGGASASDMDRPMLYSPRSTEPDSRFPHRQPPSPLPGVMEPEQAALAAELLQADRLVPIHYGAYALPDIYEPVGDPLERLVAATDRATPMKPGETIEV